MLSRRAVLEEERKEQRQAILERLQPGLIIEGQISNIVDFGAFVDLDGIDGLIHISELSWSHVNHPSEILYIGDTVQVKVLDIDRDRQRISLGLKQTQEDPWQRVVDTYSVGDELEGKVTKVVAFGAFVEILEGVEGLVHISELAQQHVENPREIVQPGDDVKVKILEIDSERRRLSLSIKRVEGQILPRRDLQAERGRAAAPATSTTCRSSGLSEDVFADAARAARAEEAADEAAEPRPRPTSARRVEAEAPRGRGRRRGAEAAADEAEAERRGRRRGARARTRSRLAAPPFVGLTGGLGAGKSEALAALARLGAATLSTDAVVHELYADPAVRDAVVARWGPEVAPGGRRRPRRGRPRTRSPRPASAPGSRACCGRASAPAWRPGGRTRPRAEPPPRALVVEVPLLFEAGMDGLYDATLAVVADEADPRRARGRPRARRGRRAHRPPARPGREGGARGSRRPQRPGSCARWSGSWPRVLEKLSREHEHAHRPPARRPRRRSAPRGRPRAAAPPARAPPARLPAPPWPSRRVAVAAAPRAVRGQGGAGGHAAAAPRGHHPPAGGGQGAGPRADRRASSTPSRTSATRPRTPARRG